MRRVNLRKARPLVVQYCGEHGIPYCEVPVSRSYLEVSRYLGRVSDEARGSTGPRTTTPQPADTREGLQL
jgi:hypothetical protein